MSIDRKQNELLRRLDITSGKLVCLALVTAFLALGCGRALAQDASSGLLAPGNAVVTHFSGSTLMAHLCAFSTCKRWARCRTARSLICHAPSF